MKILLVLFCTIFFITLAGCSSKKVEPTIGYDSFNHIEHWDAIQELEDGIIVMYFYSPYCLVCQAIEKDVFQYGYKTSKHTTVYFIHSGDILDQGNPGFDIPSTPSLIILNDRELKTILRGPLEVVNYFKENANN